MRGKVTVLRMLVNCSNTYEVLEARSGMSKWSVSKMIGELRDQALVFIESWENDSRGYPTIAKFKWGPDIDDCVKPTLTQLQRTTKFRKNRCQK